MAPETVRVTDGQVLWSEAGEYALRRLTLARAAEFDSAALATGSIRSVQWDWNCIASESQDGWCLVDEDGVPAAAFASRKKRAMNYSLGPAYRLDFFEVRQVPKDGLLTLLLTAVVASRAVDLGAETISLGSTPYAAAFWQNHMCGIRVNEQQVLWKHPLVPIVIPMQYVHELVEVFDEQRA